MYESIGDEKKLNEGWQERLVVWLLNLHEPRRR